MAYMSQEIKAKIAARVKPILKKYGMKGSLRVRNHSSIILTLTSGALDLIRNYNDVAGNKYPNANLPETGYMGVNPYWFNEHFDSECLLFLQEIHDALNLSGAGEDANYDNSDITTDYFNVGWYTEVLVGTYDKPYQHIA